MLLSCGFVHQEIAAGGEIVRVKEQDIHVLALSMIKGLGPVSIRNLIAFCGSPERVFQLPRGQLQRAPGIGAATAQLIGASDPLPDAMALAEICRQAGIEILSYLSPAYPALLKYIYDAPLILYRRGTLDFNQQPSIAIVGTRKPTPYGKDMAARFAEWYATKGIHVVSGLAYGIDITAHRSVLEAGGKTTAVLGHGLDKVYPPMHFSWAQKMLEKGAWLSEYPPGTEVDAAFFPARNRIIAGMCKAVIVVEAAIRGGALITAHQAFEQNREVYAIPGRIGDPSSEGCNHLIRDQVAKAVTAPEEVLEDLKIQWQPVEQAETAASESWKQVSAEEAKVLNLLEKGICLIDPLAQQSGIRPAALQSLLLAMEFKGLIHQLPGKKFQIRR